MRHVPWWWSFLAVGFLASGVGPAEGGDRTSPSIRHARFGTAADARNRSVMPLTVSLVNPGSEVSAELTAFSPGAEGGQRFTVRRSLRLPEQSISHVTFPFHVDVPLQTGARLGLQPGVDLELGDGRRVRWDHYQTLGRMFPEHTRTTVVVDARGSSYRWIETEGRSGQPPTEVRFPIPPRDLPRTAASLSFADVVILGHLGDTPLDTAQVDALLTWIASGGTLVHVPSPGRRPGVSGRLEALLPGIPWGGARVETLSVADAVITIFTDSGGIWKTPLVIRSGAAALGSEDDPLAISGTYGSGRIVVLGFDAGDPVFQDWAGAGDFWSEHLAPITPSRVARGDRFVRHSDSTQDTMRRMAGMPVASRVWIWVYLAVLLGGFTLCLWVGQARGRPEWGWIGAVLFGLVAGFLLLAITRRGAPERAAVLEVVSARVDADGAGATLEGGVGFFSPQDTIFHVAHADDRGFLAPGPSRIRPRPTLGSAWSEGRQEVGGVSVRASELRHAVGFARVEPAFSGRMPELRIGADGFHLALDTTARPDFEQAFFRWRRLAVPLGPSVLRGQASRPIRPDSLRDGFRYSTQTVFQESDRLRAVLATMVFDEGTESRLFPVLTDRVDRDRAEYHTPAVYAFSHQPVWPLGAIVPDSDRHALVLWRLPFQLAFDADRLLWPRGTLLRTLERTVAVAMEYPDGRVEGTGAAEMTFVFELPPESPPIRVDRLRVFFEAEGEGSHLLAELLPGLSASAEPVALTRGVTVRNDAAKFRDREGRFRVRVRVTATDTESVQRRLWIVRDMELEVEGPITREGEESQE